MAASSGRFGVAAVLLIGSAGCAIEPSVVDVPVGDARSAIVVRFEPGGPVVEALGLALDDGPSPYVAVPTASPPLRAYVLSFSCGLEALTVRAGAVELAPGGEGAPLPRADAIRRADVDADGTSRVEEIAEPAAELEALRIRTTAPVREECAELVAFGEPLPPEIGAGARLLAAIDGRTALLAGTGGALWAVQRGEAPSRIDSAATSSAGPVLAAVALESGEMVLAGARGQLLRGRPGSFARWTAAPVEARARAGIDGDDRGDELFVITDEPALARSNGPVGRTWTVLERSASTGDPGGAGARPLPSVVWLGPGRAAVLGLRSGGLSIVDGATVREPAIDAIEDPPWMIARGAGTLWIATRGGAVFVSRTSTGASPWAPERAGSLDAEVRALIPSGEDALVGTPSGAFTQVSRGRAPCPSRRLAEDVAEAIPIGGGALVRSEARLVWIAREDRPQRLACPIPEARR